jgi:hypothetical protein
MAAAAFSGGAPEPRQEWSGVRCGYPRRTFYPRSAGPVTYINPGRAIAERARPCREQRPEPTPTGHNPV